MKCRTTVDDLFKAPDDRKIVITVGELKRNFEREYNARTDKIFEEIKRDIVAQLMATSMVELNKEFGFGTGRLRRFKNGTEGLFISMAKDGIMGRKFDTQTCIDLMREKYDIDLDAKKA